MRRAMATNELQNFTLHQLNAEYDRVWSDFVATPIEERREWSAKNYEGDSETCRLWQQLRQLTTEINKRPKADFKQDLRNSLGPLMANADIAGEVYAALCNTEWEHEDGARFSCTWRYAGGLVADIRDQDENYLDWYCGGGEGHISDRVQAAMATHGWIGKGI